MPVIYCGVLWQGTDLKKPNQPKPFATPFFIFQIHQWKKWWWWCGGGDRGSSPCGYTSLHFQMSSLRDVSARWRLSVGRNWITSGRERITPVSGLWSVHLMVTWWLAHQAHLIRASRQPPTPTTTSPPWNIPPWNIPASEWITILLASHGTAAFSQTTQVIGVHVYLIQPGEEDPWSV